MPEAASSSADELARFTDREAFQDVYQKYLRAGMQPPVLVFYGVGGTGKTWLLKRLRGITPADVPQAFINLESPPAEAASALYQIRIQLKLPLDRFDFAYSLMRQKQGVLGEGKGWIDHAFDAAGSVTGAIPFTGMGAASTVLKWLKRPLMKQMEDSPFERFLHSPTGDRFLHDLSKKTSQELEDQLLTLLAEDLAALSGDHLNRAVSCVLFFDTFERIEQGSVNKNFGQVTEQWLKRIASELSGALIVIAGQNRVNWDHVGGRWKSPNSIEQHLVGGLSEIDAEGLLHNCGINHQPLRQAILVACAESSGGYHCLRLGLCIDIATSTNQLDKNLLDVFTKLNEDTLEVFAERFLKSLPSDEQNRWIRRLAVTLRFDRAAAQTAYSESRSSANDMAWRSLNKYSFLQHLESNANWYSIRAEMADALTSQPSTKDLVLEDHEFWKDYWRQRSQGPHDDAAALTWFHSYMLDRESAVADWYSLALSARGSIPPRMKEHFDFLQWWAPIERIHQKTKSPEDTLTLLTLADELTATSLGDRGKNLEHAAQIYEAALVILDQEGAQTSKATVELALSSIWLSMPKGRLDDNLQKAAFYCDSALTAFNEAESPLQWGRLQRNRGLALYQSHSGVRDQNLTNAIPYYDSALRVFTEKDHPLEWASLQIDLGAIWLNLPRDQGNIKLSRAIDCFTSALQRLSEETTPRLWAAVQSNLGAAWLNMPGGDKQDSLRRALHHLDACARVFTEDLFPEDWARLKTNFGILWANWPVGERDANLDKALENLNSAMLVYTAEAFPQGCAYLHILIGQLYQSWSNNQVSENLRLAVEHFEAALQIYDGPFKRPILASDSPINTRQIAGRQSSGLQRESAPQEDNDWFRNATKIDSLHVGSLRSLSKVLCRQGMYTEAREKLGRAMQLAPADDDLLSDLIDLEMEQAEYVEAALVCLELQRTKPGSRLWKKAKELLRAFSLNGLCDLETRQGTDIEQQSHIDSMFVALQMAVTDNRRKLTESLVKLGFRPNTPNDEGRTSMHVASQVDDLAMFKYLSSLGGDADKRDASMVLPLHLAAEKGQRAICEFIISLFPEQVGSSARDGQTPLHYAAYAGRAAVCALLIDSQPSALDSQSVDGRTALHLASLKGQESICELLLSKGSSPNLLSITGRNALHFAAQGGHKSVCKILMTWPGIDCAAKTNSGMSAADLAERAGFGEVASMIVPAIIRSTNGGLCGN